ncbi:hypothetical protein LOY86_001170, partial [Ophidiomyces ophidiicola]|uniref:uncharacterized protein n=1 Tax=Ophidiomyces ophidiicola TaxID=1387563 RepID=UPI0020C3D44B
MASATAGATTTTTSPWWPDDRVAATVTAGFVRASLAPALQAQLLHGATGDGSYLACILERARRLFVVVRLLGVPASIFALLDAGFDDADLPVAPAAALARLRLPPAVRAVFAHPRFAAAQARVLVRALPPGAHVAFHAAEPVPVDVDDDNQQAASLPLVALPAGAQLDAVTRAGASCARLRRLTLPLRAAPRYLDDDELRRETAALRRLRHAHLVSVVGSYAVPGAFHVLLAPAPTALTLRDFTAAGARPNRFKKLLKAGDDAAAALANWPACLASALAWLHHRHGLRHGALRPSNVLVGADHHVALGLFDAFDALLPTRRPLDLEAYQYAAPEHYPRPAGHDEEDEQGAEEEVLQPKLLPALTLPRRAAYARPRPSLARPASAASVASSAHNHPPITTTAPTASVASLSKPAGGAVPTNRRYDLAADVFALAALTLDILTGLCRKKHAVFERHRSAYNRRAPGYGGKLPDASFHCHRNAGQIASWIVILERDAARHKGPVYRAVAPTLAAVRPMLARRPAARPSAAAVAHRFAQALRCVASDYEPHCPVEPELEPELEPESVPPPAPAPAPDLAGPPPPPPRHPSSSTLSSGAASAFPLTPDAPAPAPADPVLDRYYARVPSSCYSFDDDPAAGHHPPEQQKQPPPPPLLHHPPKKPRSKPAPVIAPSGLDLIDHEDIGRGIDLDAG